MLSVSQTAVDALRELLPEHDGAAGRALRIVERPSPNGDSALMLALSQPKDTDLAVRDRGLELYVETEAARRLDGKRLHALSGERGVRFVLAPDPAQET
jgi:Fe-S cluster assembly iron-binding protein IscA